MVRKTPRNAPLVIRLWQHVDRSGSCWVWTGGRFSNGYGYVRIKRDGKWINGLAHRAMWEEMHGPIPEGKKVLHSCDNRACVRPDHLHLGTQSENIREMDERGRRNPASAPRGEVNGNAKLTEADVQAIRASYTGQYGEKAALARRYGVSAPLIGYVLKGGGWKHVTEVPAEAKQAIALAPRGWERYPDGCARCGETTSPCHARGVCQRCLSRERMAAKYARNRAAGLTSRGTPRAQAERSR